MVMLGTPVATAMDSAAAIGAAPIAVAAAPAISSGATNFSLAIMFSGLPPTGNLSHLIFSERGGSAELRNHFFSKPFHLLAVLGDVLTHRVQQDHLGAAVH